MPSQNRQIRDELRATLADVCETMRTQTEAVDQTTAAFRLCSRQSRESIKASKEILFRLRAAKLR